MTNLPPWGIEFDEDMRVGCQYFIEVVFGKDSNKFSFIYIGERNSKNASQS
jgi:hypothetical protein